MRTKKAFVSRSESAPRFRSSVVLLAACAGLWATAVPLAMAAGGADQDVDKQFDQLRARFEAETRGMDKTSPRFEKMSIEFFKAAMRLAKLDEKRTGSFIENLGNSDETWRAWREKTIQAVDKDDAAKKIARGQHVEEDDGWDVGHQRMCYSILRYGLAVKMLEKSRKDQTAAEALDLAGQLFSGGDSPSAAAGSGQGTEASGASATATPTSTGPPSGALQNMEPALHPVATGQGSASTPVLQGLTAQMSAEQAQKFNDAIAGLDTIRKAEGVIRVDATVRDQIQAAMEAAGYQGRLSYGQAALMAVQAQQGMSWSTIIGNALADGAQQGAKTAAEHTGLALADATTAKVRGLKPGAGDQVEPVPMTTEPPVKPPVKKSSSSSSNNEKKPPAWSGNLYGFKCPKCGYSWAGQASRPPTKCPKCRGPVKPSVMPGNVASTPPARPTVANRPPVRGETGPRTGGGNTNTRGPEGNPFTSVVPAVPAPNPMVTVPAETCPAGYHEEGNGMDTHWVKDGTNQMFDLKHNHHPTCPGCPPGRPCDCDICKKAK